LIRMFLNPTVSAPGWTGRREKTDHPSVEDAQRVFADHPQRKQFEALIYVDGTPAWIGMADDSGRVSWQAWKV
jgi:hypothetical protein